MLKIKRYIKKPLPVEAVLLTPENLKDVEGWIVEETGEISSALADEEKGWLLISTPEGTLTAYANEHYIVKGAKGEFYPVEREIFEETYEEVPGHISAEDYAFARASYAKYKASPKVVLYADDLANLHCAIAKVVLAGLEEIGESPFRPPHLSSQEWQKVLEEIEKGFKILLKLVKGAYDSFPEEEAKEKVNRINRAFRLLSEYWPWLWK